MWRFSQARGTITSAAGAVIGTGYSGHGPGLGNPAMQSIRDVGPIPQGKYSFGELVPHDPVVGEYAIPLIPDPANVMYGRLGFWIHGNDPQNDHNASEGCVVLPFSVREELWQSADHDLEVTA